MMVENKRPKGGNMSKYIFFALIVPIVIFATFSSNTNNIINPDDSRAIWDTTTIYLGSAILRRTVIANHLKGPTDDTNRIFTVQSASPRYVLLFTDISTSVPMSWRTDILETPSAGSMQVGAGDVDHDGTNDLIYAQSGTPYQLRRAYWNGSSWTLEAITTMNGASWGMDVGDADNDGYRDDIIYASGVTANCRLNWARYNGASWDTSTIWTGDGSTIQNVTIGDCDAATSGNEVVAVDGNARVMRLRYTGTTWDTMTLWQAAANGSFTAVAIGNFDAQHSGNEIAVGNGLGPGSMAIGAVLEVYGSGGSWQERPVFTPDTSENCWGLAVGDFLSTNPGDEIVKSGSFSYYVRAIYGAGDSWHNELIFVLPGSSFGAAVGNVNKYRPFNDEIALTGNNRVFEAEERISLAPFISNVSRHPLVPLHTNGVAVSAKIYDQTYPLPLADTLFYRTTDTLGTWLYVVRDSFRASDSFHFYTIPAQDTGKIVFYRIAASNPASGRSVSAIYSYQVALEHSIRQIQYTGTANDTSLDNNKWVAITGVVTGVFGRFYYAEERPGGAWHGLYIRRPNASDSLPMPSIGDSGFALGKVTEYQRTTVLEVVYAEGGWIEGVASNRPLPCTTVTTFTQAAESLEGCLVRFNNVHFNATGNFIASTYWTYNQQGESLAVYIWPYTNIVGTAIPQGQISAIGCLYQHLSPYNYELIPRATSDFISIPGIESPIINNVTSYTLKIVPNPIKAKAYIYYTLPIPKPVEVKLYNVVGKLIYTTEIPKQSNNVFALDTKSLTSGIYMLRFKTDGFEATRKLLITQ